ncbi:class I SAM-dependent methyltransferase [Paenibacillus mendelii]|uniref:Class I SAM-dependent methyltransferase n=1 Tax=Paenibacillus mendelii TaxID=206163 RepID=A0ABV6JA49_9BACL|nr:class I SAM-dependent methyltransferase [Paenibacillus mendelii]MCQ6559692.1 class I SAM-dependent methyltransferase [Paenibacillus mendelii]
MLVRDIEKSMLHAEQTGYGFGPMTISKSALVHLARRLEPGEGGQAVKLLELGGGQSTMFLSSLHRLGLLPLQVMTLEHQPSWASDLQSRADPDCVTIMRQTLKQITDEEWERVFAHPDQSARLWSKIGSPVRDSLYGHYTLRNAFYSEAHDNVPGRGTIDAMIIDGPHGNGRSLAFPLFVSALKQGAYVLIDDFDHYPFSERFGPHLPLRRMLP